MNFSDLVHRPKPPTTGLQPDQRKTHASQTVPSTTAQQQRFGDLTGVEHQANAVAGRNTKSERTGVGQFNPFPMADDGLDADAESSLFVRQAAPRALDRTNKPALTQCFQPPYDTRPHHHILSCEHCVLTDELEPCGPNCLTVRTSAPRARGRQLLCGNCVAKNGPYPEVKVEESIIFIKKPKTKREKPVLTHPSHTYSGDAEVDEMRFDENKSEAIKDPMALCARNGGEACTRPIRGSKRSASPTDSEAHLLQQPPQKKQALGSSTNDEPTAIIDPAELFLVERMAKARGPLVVFLPRREAARLKIDAEPGLFGRPSTGHRITRRRQEDVAAARRTKPNLAQAPSTRAGREQSRQTRSSNNNSRRILNVRPSSSKKRERVFNQIVAENEGFDIGGESCEPQALLDFAGNDDAQKADAMEDEVQHLGSHFDMPETYCICDAHADETLVACDRCSKHYHPSCIDKGLCSSVDYEGERREECLRSDATTFLEESMEFTCLACDEKENLAQARISSILKRKVPDSGRQDQLRARAKQNGIVDNRPSLAVQERVALKKAGNDVVARAAIEADFKARTAKLESEMQDPPGNGEGMPQHSSASSKKLLQAKHARVAAKEKLTLAAKQMVEMNFYFCDHCDHLIEGVRRRCRDCRTEVDLCDGCFKLRKHKFSSHKFNIILPRPIVSVAAVTADTASGATPKTVRRSARSKAAVGIPDEASLHLQQQQRRRLHCKICLGAANLMPFPALGSNSHVCQNSTCVEVAQYLAAQARPQAANQSAPVAATNSPVAEAVNGDGDVEMTDA